MNILNQTSVERVSAYQYAKRSLNKWEETSPVKAKLGKERNSSLLLTQNVNLQKRFLKPINQKS